MRASDLPHLVLEGTPLQQGQAYGRAVTAQIHAFRAFWWRELQADGIDAAAWEAQLSQRYAATHQQLVPGFMGFIDGISQGAGLAPETVFAMNMLDEDAVLRRLRRGAPTARASEGERCTVLAGRGVSGWVGGQTQDWSPGIEGLQVHLHFTPSTGMERHVLALAGMVAMSGMNARGLASFQNQVLQLDGVTDGVSVAAVVHELLQCTDRAEAMRKLTGWPHASGQAYTLLDSHGVTGLEASASGVRVYPTRPHGHFTHTNHPLLDEGWRDDGDAASGITAVSARTRARHERICELADQQARLEPERLMRFFADRTHPVCPISLELAPDAELSGYTLGAMVCEAGGPAGPRFWMSAGPPSVELFQLYPFSN